MNFIFFILFFSFPPVQAKICQNTHFRYKNKKIEKKQALTICKNKSYLLSENCRDLNCQHLKQYQGIKIDTNPIGNPGFTLCHRKNGRPVIGEYFSKSKRKWVPISFCFDKDFKEFLPISLLIRMAAGVEIREISKKTKAKRKKQTSKSKK